MSSETAKPNIADRIKSLLSSFIHSQDLLSQAEQQKNLTEEDSNSTQRSVTSKPSVVTSFPPVAATSTRHEAFIRRIEGFTTQTWFGKPVQLSPLRCARYGWENSDKDILRCVSCREFLCCRLHSPADDEYLKEVETLEKNLVQGHRMNCSWRVNPCPGLSLPELVTDRQSAVDQFMSRLVSLNSLKLPPVNFSFPDQRIGISDQLKQLVTDSRMAGMLGLIDLSDAACLIAVCGWAAKPGHENRIISCAYCCRKIGIWKYNKDSNTDGENSPIKRKISEKEDSENSTKEEDNEVEPKTKRRKVEPQEATAFDPVSEHKYWCVWLLPSNVEKPDSELEKLDCTKPKPQESSEESKEAESPGKGVISKSENLPGWKWYLYTLLPTMNPDSVRTSQRLLGDIKTTPAYEGLKNIRHLFSDWISTQQGGVEAAKKHSPEKLPEKSVSKKLEFENNEKSASEKLELEKNEKSASEKLELENYKKSASEKLEFEKNEKSASEKLEFENNGKSASEKLEFENNEKSAAEKLEFENNEKSASEKLELEKNEKSASEKLEFEKNKTSASEKLEFEKNEKSASEKLEFEKNEKSASEKLEFEKDEKSASEKLEFEKNENSASEKSEFEKSENSASEKLDFEKNEKSASEKLEFEKNEKSASEKLEFENNN